MFLFESANMVNMYKLAVRYNICIKGIIKEEDYSVPLPNL